MFSSVNLLIYDTAYHVSFWQVKNYMNTTQVLVAYFTGMSTQNGQPETFENRTKLWWNFFSLTVSKLFAYFIVDAPTQKGVFESMTIQQTFRGTILVGKIINLFLASVIFIDDVSELA